MRNASRVHIQVRYGGVRLCDGTRSASVWPSPRQTPGPSCPFPSDKTPPDATMKPGDAPSAWSSPSDLDRKKSDGRDPPQGVAPHAHRGVVGAPNYAGDFPHPSLPEYQVIGHIVMPPGILVQNNLDRRLL